MSTENHGGGLLQGEALTAEERAYMDSAGTAELEAPAPSPVPPPNDTRTVPDDTDGDNPGTDGDAEGFDDDIDVEIDEDGQARDKATGKFVPKSVALRYKQQAKETKDKLAQVALELVRRRERDAVFRELAQRETQQPEASEQEREIDPTEDIFGAYAQLSKKVAQLTEQLGKQDQTVRGQFEQISLQQAATRDMQTFVQTEPAFLDAYKFLEGQRHAELEALGVVDLAQRQEIVRKEARELVEGALRSRASGAERIYKLAVARGFKPASQAGATPPAIDPNAAEKIDRINRGQKAATSLRNAGGTSDAGQALTPQKLADMNDHEFSQARTAYIKKHGIHAWDKFIGGA